MCFNQPFDESRIADRLDDVALARVRARLQPHPPHLHRTLTARRMRASIARAPSPTHSTRNAPARASPTRDSATTTTPHGVFLDLRQLLYALTGEGHSLASGCAAFGVPFAKDQPPLGRLTAKLISYARRDTDATRLLLQASLAEYARRGLRLPPDQAYSVASLGKAAIKQMGVRPILERQPDFPRDILGATMAAFYGGRAECHIRCTAGADRVGRLPRPTTPPCAA